MYKEDQATIKTLMSALSQLQHYNEQIMQGERAKAQKPKLMIEINGLYRELCEEEAQDG